MGKTASEKLKLGVFVIIGTILIVVGAYLIGNNQSLFNKTFVINTVVSNVNGLQVGNNVRFSGINVGTVKSIEMENDTSIRIRMVIDENMLQYIRKDAVVTIGSDGFVGSMIVNIIPGEGARPLIAPNDELRSYSRIATQDMLRTLNVTTENAAMLTSNLLKVSESMVKGNGTLGKLLNDTLMARDLQQTITNLKHSSNTAISAIAGLNNMIGSMNFEESTAGLFLSDTLSAQKIRTIIDHLETSGGAVEEMLKELNVVISDVKEGRGAIHYLSQDTTLVHHLQNTMKNVDEGSRRFNENMEALKHSFLTRRYFRKLERKQKKEAEQALEGQL
ncbi:phospholipid/cholesterol/gamma-HCH transport system substrate-binding protein [Arenibacter nanhaiticus]|uniref:Phospholipid/cholesterol/gamma-HCH transport system substrate-binding protein n=1 Tax=Arenibacter nanhaiticus TaxID=558155 RepID=A0A1M6JA30_9FLAO|nr:MlaD family protein [Arenibacter nanhaiticus]SHJ43484.1 phospholipid/cholesterol/gamma-HCH transport system substrate-binding protein [Arenibacter nanhaiticus]